MSHFLDVTLPGCYRHRKCHYDDGLSLAARLPLLTQIQLREYRSLILVNWMSDDLYKDLNFIMQQFMKLLGCF